MQIVRKTKEWFGSGEIRTRASEETGALNQRLRPLGHATLLYTCEKFLILVLRILNISLDKLATCPYSTHFTLSYKFR